jgi:DNA adenine methylase
MPTTSSPLRYPGGKTKLYVKIIDILKQNNLKNVTYIEPFAGGCGLALKLLFHNDVSNIVINDIDPTIFSFWYSVLNNTDELITRLMKCEVTISEREKQLKIINSNSGYSVLDVGFATLFLNRTNISGILDAGPIGGRDQSGTDKIDARFKKAVLKEKILSIAKQKDRILLFNLDVIDFIDNVLLEISTQNFFVNFDPPYVVKGNKLYLNYFTLEDHERLRDKISQCDRNWIVTYDYVDSIIELYDSFKYERIQLNYSAGSKKKGEEVIIYSNNLKIPKQKT